MRRILMIILLFSSHDVFCQDTTKASYNIPTHHYWNKHGYGIVTGYEISNNAFNIGVHTQIYPLIRNKKGGGYIGAPWDKVTLDLLMEFPFTKNYYGFIFSTNYDPLTLFTYKPSCNFSNSILPEVFKMGFDILNYTDFTRNTVFIRPTIGLEVPVYLFRSAEPKTINAVFNFKFTYGYNFPLQNTNIFSIPTSTYTITLTTIFHGKKNEK